MSNQEKKKTYPLSEHGEQERLEISEAKKVDPTNPKDVIGSAKAPMHHVPSPIKFELGLAMFEGARKYGSHNYRAVGVRAMVYYDAACRHLDQWLEGEDTDKDSGLPHLAKAMACLAIIRDSQLMGNWVDDRPPKLPNGLNMERLDALAAKLVEMYPDCKEPYTELGEKKKACGQSPATTDDFYSMLTYTQIPGGVLSYEKQRPSLLEAAAKKSRTLLKESVKQAQGGVVEQVREHLRNFAAKEDNLSNPECGADRCIVRNCDHKGGYADCSIFQGYKTREKIKQGLIDRENGTPTSKGVRDKIRRAIEDGLLDGSIKDYEVFSDAAIKHAESFCARCINSAECTKDPKRGPCVQFELSRCMYCSKKTSCSLSQFEEDKVCSFYDDVRKKKNNLCNSCAKDHCSMDMGITKSCIRYRYSHKETT